MRANLVRSIVAIGLLAAAAPQHPAVFNKTRVTFRSGGLTLVGYAYHPDGNGPFPTVIWNHGSEKNPGGGPQFDSVAAVFVPAGYAVFAPMRRGHSDSEGRYIVDALNAARAIGDGSDRKLMVRLLETEQLGDQLAGVAYAKTLPFIDARRLVVAGCSFGGIQTLLAAERAGYRIPGRVPHLAGGADMGPHTGDSGTSHPVGACDQHSSTVDPAAKGRESRAGARVRRRSGPSRQEGISNDGVSADDAGQPAGALLRRGEGIPQLGKGRGGVLRRCVEVTGAVRSHDFRTAQSSTPAARRAEP